MNQYKKGFTLSEVLICIVIIGVIMALSVNAIKIVRESYTSLTYFAFKNLKDMIGVLYSGDSPVYGKLTEGDNSYLSSMVTQCRKEDGTIISILKSDSETYGIVNCLGRDNYSGSNDNLFCKSLASIANTVGSVNCSKTYSVGYQQNTNGITEPYISDLAYDSPNFITTNGQRFYISKWSYSSGDVSKNYGFRIVAIDLNATSKPNKMFTGASIQPPDIVMFLVLDNGEVFPLDVAADNLKKNDGRIFQYLNSKVKGYYYTYDSDRTDNIPSECTVGGTKLCNYAVVYLTNDKDKSFFSYREAYCKSKPENERVYSSYCSGISLSEYCPPSTNEKSFDLCRVDTVKPLFRYNFK